MARAGAPRAEGGGAGGAAALLASRGALRQRCARSRRCAGACRRARARAPAAAAEHGACAATRWPPPARGAARRARCNFGNTTFVPIDVCVREDIFRRRSSPRSPAMEALLADAPPKDGAELPLALCAVPPANAAGAGAVRADDAAEEEEAQQQQQRAHADAAAGHAAGEAAAAGGAGGAATDDEEGDGDVAAPAPNAALRCTVRRA
jgi:hypothetical protein